MTNSLCRLFCGLLCTAVLSCGIAVGQAVAEEKQEKKDAEPAKEAKPESAACKPQSVAVAKGAFRMEVNLEGILEAQKMSEIVMRPKEWSDLTILSAVPHGTRVRRGDLIAVLDPEKIERAIADARYEQQLTALALQQAEQEARTLEVITPLDLAASRRAERVAGEDAKHFLEVAKPQAIKLADFILRVAKQRLEYQEEELRQLEKMYKADDLTEETEQIVLKRARDAVEQARFGADTAKIERDEALKFTIPRNEEKVKETAQRATLAGEKNQIVLPVMLEKQRVELAKLKLQRTRTDDKLGKLLADREAMNIKSPIDGVVYYGSCERGKWSAATTEDLRRGTSISANKVFMTVVEPRPMFVRVVVPEKQLANVRAGQSGVAKPAAFPELKLAAIVESVAVAPFSSGSFDGRVTVSLDDRSERLMPGMNCEVRLVPYEKADALTAPPAAVQLDETDDRKALVYRVGKDGKTEKQAVSIGRRTDKLVEIFAGLAEGDEILAEFPKDKK